jgi:predicted RND superfamily exporter protein
MNWRLKTEERFEIFSDWIYDNAKKCILFVFVFVASIATQLPTLTIDTSTEGFLHKTDPLRIAYDEFRSEFGRDEKLLVAIKTKDIFNLDFLKRLEKFHKTVEQELPYITGVNSLINARNTYGDEDSLIVGELFEPLPNTRLELIEKKQRSLANPLSINLLYNEDQTFTTVIIDTQTYSSFDADGNLISSGDDDEFDDDSFSSEEFPYLTDEENTRIVEKLQQVSSSFQSDDFDIYLTGSAVVAATLKQSMMKDVEGFIQKMVVSIVVVLFLLFRRMSGVFLPLICVSLTVVSTVSIMTIFNAPLTMATQLMPSFLLAVITGAAIHLLAVFYKDLSNTDNVKKSLRYAMGHSGFAIVMTSITTAAGMWSFSFSEIAPVADLGVFASAGILIGLIFTLVLLPALISIIKFKKVVKSQNSLNQTTMDRVLLNISRISTTYTKSIIFISASLVVVAIFFATQLRFSHYPLNWFPENDPSRVATEIVDKELRGSITLEVVVDTGVENGLYDPSLLNKIEEATNYFNSIQTGTLFVGKTLSIVDVIKESNKALNENQDEFYTIPQDRDMIAQELLLFENSGSEDLQDFASSDFSKARITVKVPYVESLEYNDFIYQTQIELDSLFGSDAKVSLTGISVMLSDIMGKSIFSSAISYLLAFGVISIMMIVLVGSVKIGMISMIPNVLPLLLLSIVMAIFDMPLDMFTMLIGTIALGLAVDDTVHFMHNFRRFELQYNDVDTATRLTLMGTGRAITVTSIVLSMGFLVLTTATMSNMFNFGVLTVIAILVALLADFFLVPAIMKIIIKSKEDVL